VPIGNEMRIGNITIIQQAYVCSWGRCGHVLVASHVSTVLRCVLPGLKFWQYSVWWLEWGRTNAFGELGWLVAAPKFPGLKGPGSRGAKPRERHTHLPWPVEPAIDI
jgi:hypothetical protein